MTRIVVDPLLANLLISNPPEILLSQREWGQAGPSTSMEKRNLKRRKVRTVLDVRIV